jgi:hypothetical protein
MPAASVSALAPTGSTLPLAAISASPLRRPARAAPLPGHWPLQAVAVVQHRVGGVDEFAGVGVFVLGGEAEQVARLRAAQVRVVDQQGTGDAVQAILQSHHLAQLRARCGHLGGDFRRRFGHAADHCGRRFRRRRLDWNEEQAESRALAATRDKAPNLFVLFIPVLRLHSC